MRGVLAPVPVHAHGSAGWFGENAVQVLVSTVVAIPVFQAGAGAYGEGRKLAADVGWRWLDVHMSRTEKGIHVFYLAPLAAAGRLRAREEESFV